MNRLMPLLLTHGVRGLKRSFTTTFSRPQEVGTPSQTQWITKVSRCGHKVVKFRLPMDDDSAAPKSVEYFIIEDAEHLNGYCPGGYHVVRLGDRLKERYEIIHKLGFGSYSTIWLARDRQEGVNVAIKIGVAETDRPRESAMLSMLHAGKEQSEAYVDAGKAAIPALLDEVEVHGPNGEHHCLVTPPARVSLAISGSDGTLYPLTTARAIAAQLMQAVAFVHSKGVVHGDLNQGNMLLDLPASVKKMQPEELYKKYGKPYCEEVERIDGEPLDEHVPKEIVHSAILLERRKMFDTLGLEDAKILLTDFGESFQPDTTIRLESRSPIILRPPEQLTGEPRAISCPSDVWAIGCNIFQILAGRSFIEGWFVSEDRTLAEQIEALGPLPARLWDSWANRAEWFTEDGKPSNNLGYRSLKELIDAYIVKAAPERSDHVVDEAEAQALEKLLRAMLALDADRRITAKEALESEWMTKWALPDLERAQELWEQAEQEAKQASSGVDKDEKRREEASGGSDREEMAGEGSQAPAMEDEAAAPALEEESPSRLEAAGSGQEQGSAVFSGGRRQSGQAILNMAVKKRVDTASQEKEGAGNAAGKEEESAQEKDGASAVEEGKTSEKASEA